MRVVSICGFRAALMTFLALVPGCTSVEKVTEYSSAKDRSTHSYSPKITPSEFSRAHAAAMKASRRRASAVLDENSVPHLFAENRGDLIFSQGYTHAYFRLWQMETSARLVEGTLSEVIGARGLEFDKYSFSMRLEELARDASRELESDPRTREMIENYLAGIHARQDQLETAERALSSEYRSRSIKPRRFSSLDIVRLGFARSVGQFDPFAELRLSLARAKLGKEMFDDIFPWPNSSGISERCFGRCDF